MQPLVLLEEDETSATLTLNRPDRHNSLVPELLASLNTHLDRLESRPNLLTVILKANGPSFSTGGDVKAFWEAEDRASYAKDLVGALNEAIMKLLSLPCQVIANIDGPVTGGSIGLLLAADLVVITKRTFLQPFYSVVGFAPDGGWTAILPDRIGSHQANRILCLNEKVDADLLLQYGLADAIKNEPGEQVTVWKSKLAAKVPGSVSISKDLLRESKLVRYRQGLERERQAFIERINHPEVTEGMRRFLMRS